MEERIKELIWNADASWVIVKGDNISRSVILSYFRQRYPTYAIEAFKGMETTERSNGWLQERYTTDYCRDNWLLRLGPR